MTRTLILRTDFSAEAFANFGAVVAQPQTPGERMMLSAWLGGEGLSPVFHTNAVPVVTLPHTVRQLECHPHAAQAFVPLDVSRYLVTVAPSDAEGAPLLSQAQSFVVPGTVGIIYKRAAWHAGATVLDRDGSFAVLMWRGSSDDDVMLDIPPLRLAADETLEPMPAKDHVTA